MQANGAEGRKNNRLRKEKKGKNLTKVDRYLQGKRGVPTTGKLRLVAGNTIRAEARYRNLLLVIITRVRFSFILAYRLI